MAKKRKTSSKTVASRVSPARKRDYQDRAKKAWRTRRKAAKAAA